MMRLFNSVLRSLPPLGWTSPAVMAGLSLFAILGTSCNPHLEMIPEAPNPEEIPPTDPHRIQTFYQVNPEHAESLLKNHKTVHVLDLRPAEAFAAGHLPGAIHLPWDAEDFVARLADFDKATPILAYSDLNPSAFVGANHIRGDGFLNVYWLSLGFPSWVDAQKPVRNAEGKKLSQEEALALANAEKEAVGVPTEP